MYINVASPEMRRYMSTGRCPHCERQILNSGLTFLSQNLNLSGGSGLNFFDRMRLVPSDASVTYTPGNTLTCGFCGETWEVRVPRELAPRNRFGRSAILADVSTPGTDPVSLNSMGLANVGPRALDPARFRFTGVAEGVPVEVLSRVERKVLPNGSNATVTDMEEFTWSVDRTVTVEDRNATIQGTDGRFNIAGLATLGKQLTSEVRTMYAVTTQTTLTRKKSVSCQLPPHSKIEIELTWRVVRQFGMGVFAGTGDQRLEMPYAVDVDLTVDWHTRNLGG